MPRVLPLLLVPVLALAACQRPRPGTVVAMEPRPNPPVGAPAKPAPDNPRERLRQNRWLAQFWEELTPAQSRRVADAAAQLHRRVEVPGADHNDRVLLDGAVLVDAVTELAALTTG